MPKLTLSAVCRSIAGAASVLPLLFDGTFAVAPGRTSKEVYAQFSGSNRGFNAPFENILDTDDESDPSSMTLWLRERADEYNDFFPLRETSTVLSAQMTPYRGQSPGPIQPKCFFWSNVNKVSQIFYDDHPLTERHEDSAYMGCYSLDGKVDISTDGSDFYEGDPDKQIAALVIVDNRAHVIIKPLLDDETFRTTSFAKIYPFRRGNVAGHRMRVQILDGPDDTVCTVSGGGVPRDRAAEYSATVGQPMERIVYLPRGIECRSASMEQT